MQKAVKILVDMKKYSLETIRYAAYALSGGWYVLLTSGKGRVEAAFSPKKGAAVPGRNRAAFAAAGAGRSAPGLKKLFLRELEDEKFREKLFGENRELHYWLLKRAINHVPGGEKSKDDSGLTPEQEKELEQLIAQVENEIKQGKGDSKDITRTWEQKYGKKTRR
ncbi:MAG: hypothetical protein FD189_245 [Elusimicrobia bacterium]|nr:MAG: hypothetical protein FD154_45 [Elusimicrobiota bacterium]KAF0157978.1 MAG: hypothetical protein FD189_245 [Elusimicrobiota bacterium]